MRKPTSNKPKRVRGEEMNHKNMIKITGVDLVAFVQTVYSLSKPQGYGHFHFRPGTLSEQEAREEINENNPRGIVVNIDYLLGRACKMVVYKDLDTKDLYIKNSWFDHSNHDLKVLLNSVGIEFDYLEIEFIR